MPKYILGDRYHSKYLSSPKHHILGDWCHARYLSSPKHHIFIRRLVSCKKLTFDKCYDVQAWRVGILVKTLSLQWIGPLKWLRTNQFSTFSQRFNLTNRKKFKSGDINNTYSRRRRSLFSEPVAMETFADGLRPAAIVCLAAFWWQ